MELPTGDNGYVRFPCQMGGNDNEAGLHSLFLGPFQWFKHPAVFPFEGNKAGGPNISLFVFVGSKGLF